MKTRILCGRDASASCVTKWCFSSLYTTAVTNRERLFLYRPAKTGKNKASGAELLLRRLPERI